MPRQHVPIFFRLSIELNLEGWIIVLIMIIIIIIIIIVTVIKMRKNILILIKSLCTDNGAKYQNPIYKVNF